MTTDTDGHTHYRVRTPEGIWVDGPSFTRTELFDSLNQIRFADPPPPSPSPTAQDPKHRQQRTIAKHQRRQQEREHNRAAREAAELTEHVTRAGRQQSSDTSDSDGDPPF
ncbi:hypothetical protein [Gordonia sp. CPCC 205333]|uniref:hypothetical protein n=1 Tax=Gordonia sp. CPCC 205333 TaxID=3140790 RepID=UPI003AF3CCCC